MSMSSTSSLVDGPGLYSEDRLCSQLEDEDDIVTMGSSTAKAPSSAEKVLIPELMETAVVRRKWLSRLHVLVSLFNSHTNLNSSMYLRVAVAGMDVAATHVVFPSRHFSSLSTPPCI